MPCVFPVLSIKILSLVETVNDSNHSLRLHGWVYAAGVIASFITIAALLILLRLGGESIGWGFQLPDVAWFQTGFHIVESYKWLQKPKYV